MFEYSLLSAVVIIAAFVLSIVNLVSISTLRGLVDFHRREIEALKRAQAALQADSQPLAAPPKAQPAAAAPPPPSAATAPPQPQAAQPTAPQTIGEFRPVPHVARAATPPIAERQKTLERQFGGRAFVWLGGVALALAGFFLVKYSIDIGLLTEGVRVVLGVLFGFALLGGSQAVRARKGLADGVRIAQALAGAGIADLYGSLFAATTLYHLMPSWLGFAAMAAVTAVALLLSLRHGAPIAALGLIGGYATPMLIQGEPNAPLLFGYLYLLFGGLAIVIRRQNWHWLSIPASLIAFAWVLLWLLSGSAFKDGGVLSLFLLGVGATAAMADRGEPVALFSPRFWMRGLAPAGALILMACVTYATKFSTFEWGMFGLFSAGTIALAWFDDRSYGFAPWLAFTANLAMLLAWVGADSTSLVVVIAAFAALFVASSQALLNRSGNPLSWAGLSTAATLTYFLFAYGRLEKPLLGAAAQSDVTWAAIAFAAAAVLTLAASRRFVAQSEIALRHRMQAIFAGGATALLSIGLAILLHQEFLSFAVAAEVLAICWIATRVDVPALRVIAQVLSGLFAVLLVPDLGQLLAVPNAFFLAVSGHLATTIVFRYGLPAAFFATASLLLRRERDDPFVRILELGAIALVAMMTYRIVELAFLGASFETGLFARSIYTGLLILLSLAALRIAGRYHRVAALWGAGALALLALGRIVGFELLLYNPLWAHVFVGPTPLLNGLLLAYGLPAIGAILIARDLKAAGQAPFAFAARAVGFLLAFIFISMSVRQFYAGAYLDAVAVGSAEIYTYSAVWLLAGVGLLFAAVLRNDMTMRVASLAVLLLTVGKVFLFDASALTGLWRVVSFLGLGLSLLGLSWFYTRFVFVSDRPESPA